MPATPAIAAPEPTDVEGAAAGTGYGGREGGDDALLYGASPPPAVRHSARTLIRQDMRRLGFGSSGSGAGGNSAGLLESAETAMVFEPSGSQQWRTASAAAQITQAIRC